MIMLAGKKILVLGVANQKSIAWGIAERLHQNGAELALTYVNEAIEKRLRPLAETISCNNVLPCDVSSDQDLDNLFAELGSRWGRLDGVVHSVAFAEQDDLKKPFSETCREGFKKALDISAYSLIGVSGRAKRLMPDGGSILTLTYLGAVRAVPNYNIMGVAKAALESSVRYLAADLGGQNIRVNAISAGPIKTLAASGIPQFKSLLAQFAEKAPLRRNVTQEDVAGTALYLLSPLSSGVTGEVVYVDCGFNIIAM
ncbi:MAG: enoyl-ACP reductase [Candidatus Dadabacteria bacterium]|nr:MAG: enoyl-ACP reductase [Candidatus Dadabacteria bacterium]